MRARGVSSALTGVLQVSCLSISLITLGACGSVESGENGSEVSGDETPTMLFSANDGVIGYELWKTDGTQEGTVLVKDINPSAGSSPSASVPLNGFNYFATNDGVNGNELWKTNGTSAGTVLVKDINPGAADSSPTGYTLYNGALYFQADDGVNGPELWKTDGTADGTVLVKDISPAGAASNFNSFIVNSDMLFFIAQGRLWKTDGSTDGTVLVKDISVGPNLVVLNGELYFGALDDNVDGGLWKSDGTEAGTVLVRLIDNVYGETNAPNKLIVNNGLIFFKAGDSVYENTSVLWKSSGSAEGTMVLRKFRPPRAGRQVPVYFIVFNGEVYFTADDGVNGYEIWKTDGTVEGTTMVKDIHPVSSVEIIPSYPYGPYGFTVFNNALYFNGNDGANGTELWKTDGTPEGTIMVKDINPTNDTYARPAYLTVFNNALYFQADDGVNGAELWKTDGTEAGTVLVKDINTAPGAGSHPTALAVLNGNP